MSYSTPIKPPSPRFTVLPYILLLDLSEVVLDFGGCE
jgi:hypothetical protein